MVRYAIPKPEPLAVEHAGFRDAVIDGSRRHRDRGRGPGGASAWRMRWRARLRTNDRRGAAVTDVCVVGLGKIGLPLACAIARGGHRVRGADSRPTVVDKVNRAEEPFPGEAGLAEALAETVAVGPLDGDARTPRARSPRATS